MNNKSDGSTAMDVQIGGGHYKGMAIQPMEYSMKNGLDACQHTAIKYISRFRDKGGIGDLEKAKHCIDMLIHFERDKPATDRPDGMASPFPDTHLDFDEERVDRVASSHGDGEHYDDMTNPANWRAGDLVECVKLQPPTATKVGGLYRLISVSGIAPTIIDEEGDSQLLGCKTFRFHSRQSADGWIDWAGGECPCDRLSRVGVMFRGGDADQDKAGGFRWQHIGASGDIIRYRML